MYLKFITFKKTQDYKTGDNNKQFNKKKTNRSKNLT